jgi:holo-[acyl-carrier protein] synthase
MVATLGIDVEEVARFKELYQDDHFLRLIFTEKEISYCKQKKEPYVSFAGKFCAKEAVVKAFPCTIAMKDIEIVNNESGRPEVFIKGERKPEIQCSISHTVNTAVACVLMHQQ